MEGSDKSHIKQTAGTKEDFKAVEAASSVHSSSEGSCLRRMKGLIPPVYRNELLQLFKLAGPVVRVH